MNEILAVKGDERFPIDGRELHLKLEIETRYNDWFSRMCEYGFSEGTDFETVLKNEYRADGTRMPQKSKNHMLSLSMAKEICMIQRTEIGRSIRKYLIEIENAWNSPEQIMSRALKIADKTIEQLKGKVMCLEADNSRLTVEKQIMQPKADYFDDLVDRNLLTGIRETAKQLGVKEKEFVAFMIAKKYLYRDKKGKLMPCAEKNNGLFELKECLNEKTEWAGTQTMFTPKGRETFRLLTEGMRK